MKGRGIEKAKNSRLKKHEKLLMDISDSFGLTKHDFKDGHVIYTKWGTTDNHIDVENLGARSLKISKDLGDVYLDKIRTDEYIIVGKGTTLHCDDMKAGKGIEKDFEGFLM